jgi:hypothetical protein
LWQVHVAGGSIITARVRVPTQSHCKQFHFINSGAMREEAQSLLGSINSDMILLSQEHLYH